MAPVTRKKTADTSERTLVIAVDSFVCRPPGYGYDVPVARGTRWAADDPVAKLAPKLFVPADSTDQEVHAARAALIPDAPPGPGPRFKPLRDEDCVVALRTEKYVWAGGHIQVNEGDRLPKDHPLVAREPHLFRPYAAEVDG